MNNYQLKYSKTQVFNTRFAVKDMMGQSGGGGTSPQYIKGVNPIYTDGDIIPIPIFFTADFVNQAIATNLEHVVSLSLSQPTTIRSLSTAWTHLWFYSAKTNPL